MLVTGWPPNCGLGIASRSPLVGDRARQCRSLRHAACRQLANSHAADTTRIRIHVHVRLRRINCHAAPRTNAAMIWDWFIGMPAPDPKLPRPAML
jgi:hypothetical protein